MDKMLLQMADTIDANFIPKDLRVPACVLKARGVRGFQTTMLFLKLCQKLTNIDSISYYAYIKMLDNGIFNLQEVENKFILEIENITEDIYMIQSRFERAGGRVSEFLPLYAKDLFYGCVIDPVKNTIQRTVRLPPFLMPIDKAKMAKGILAPSERVLKTPADYDKHCAGFLFAIPRSDDAPVEYKIAPSEEIVKFYLAGGKIKYAEEVNGLLISPNAKGAMPESEKFCESLKKKATGLNPEIVTKNAFLLQQLSDLLEVWIEEDLDPLTLYEQLLLKKTLAAVPVE